MAHVVCEPCIGVKDTACVETCSVDCFYDAGDMLVIHPDECIDCGLCIPACPVSAIFAEGDVPEQWKHFIEKNKQYFVDTPDYQDKEKHPIVKGPGQKK